MAKKINLIVFDFDGTLSAFDSNMEFGKYCFKHSVRPWVFLPIIGIAFIIKYIKPKSILWREMMRSFLTQKMVKKLAPGFIKQHKLNRFGWAAEQVESEKSKPNTKVILISAGPNYLIPQLVSDIKFDAVISSDLEKSRPWKFKFFAWNTNKVVAMNNWAKKNGYDINFVRSYSDNKSDRPIMKLAREQVWINPKTGSRI